MGEVIEYDIGTKGRITYPNGDIYDGLFEDRRRHGVGTFLLTNNGGKYEGAWQDGKKSGFGKEYNGSVNEYYEGYFVNNKKEGNGKMINKKGEVFEGDWKAGKKVASMAPKEKITKEEYMKFINHFMKNKTSSEPMVRIIA